MIYYWFLHLIYKNANNMKLNWSWLANSSIFFCFFLDLYSISENIWRRFSHFRSSHQRCSIRKGVLRNFAKFTRKRLCQSLFFNKIAGLRRATLLKKRLCYRCFPVNFSKFLRTPFSDIFTSVSASLLNILTQSQ